MTTWDKEISTLIECACDEGDSQSLRLIWDVAFDVATDKLDEAQGRRLIQEHTSFDMGADL